MKRVVFLALVLLGLGVVSCNKENIRPIASDNEGVPVWKSSTPAPTTSVGTTDSTVGQGITDPNNDEDGSSKRRKQ
jgi:hypothetical protein